MWLAFTVIHTFLLALVNYSDEFLASNNVLPKKNSIHTKVGSVLLMSTLMSFVGALLVFLFTRDVSLSGTPLLLAIVSAVPLAMMLTSYFYLLQMYPVHQVAPLGQLSTIWLLVIESFFGKTITLSNIIGIAFLMYGAYLLDSGSFKWKIPTKLLAIAIPATSFWAISLLLVKAASQNTSSITVSFWQLVGMGIIGVILLVSVKSYRDGFLHRVKHQGKTFLGLSSLNETFSESGYVFSNLAIATAPVAAFVTAMSGLQSLFLLLLFWLFPQGERTHITKMQMLAIGLIAIGIFFIENSFLTFGSNGR